MVTTPAFDIAVDFVLNAEDRTGTGVITTDDGGVTRWGISQRQYPSVDVRSLTRQDAIAIYQRDYWNLCDCDQLPASVAFVLFDAAVNQGQPHAVRMLQAALGVVIDGHIGPKTIAAAGRLLPRVLVTELTARRLLAYGLDDNFKSDGLGWCRRACACQQAAGVVV